MAAPEPFNPLTTEELEKPLAFSEWSAIANCIGIAIEHTGRHGDTATVEYLIRLHQRAIHQRDAASHFGESCGPT